MNMDIGIDHNIEHDHGYEQANKKHGKEPLSVSYVWESHSMRHVGVCVLQHMRF